MLCFGGIFFANRGVGVVEIAVKPLGRPTSKFFQLIKWLETTCMIRD